MKMGETEAKMTTRKETLFGTAIVILSILSILELFYFISSQRSLVACQTRVNAIFLDTIKERSDIFEASDRSVRNLAVKAFSARNDTEMLEAYQHYLVTEERLDARRDAAAYPDIEKVCVE
jgi:hypothetical protein